MPELVPGCPGCWAPCTIQQAPALALSRRGQHQTMTPRGKGTYEAHCIFPIKPPDKLSGLRAHPAQPFLHMCRFPLGAWRRPSRCLPAQTSRADSQELKAPCCQESGMVSQILGTLVGLRALRSVPPLLPLPQLHSPLLHTQDAHSRGRDQPWGPALDSPLERFVLLLLNSALVGKQTRI